MVVTKITLFLLCYITNGLIQRFVYEYMIIVTQFPGRELVILCSTTKSKKGKVFYAQEPPGGESTTTECGFNYQPLAVIY